MEYRVDDFGAKGNGINDDTLAINEAIRFCANEKGTLIFSENKCYRAGLIRLLSDVTLFLEKGSIIKAIDELDGFKIDDSKIKLVNEPTYDNCDYDGKPTMHFLYAKNETNIKIIGEGIIDGNEEIFYGEIKEFHIDGYFYPRVPLIYFENCKNIVFEDITLRKSAFWTVHLVGCDGVRISNCNIINNMILANCDGIDPDHSKNILIENCAIEAADDCIVFKTTEAFKKYGNCENVEVRNCVLSSTSAAIKFGTETTGVIRNINIHDCKIINSNRGISFQLRDEGSIENITFNNISIDTHRVSDEDWWGKAEGIALTGVKRKEDTKVGYINNIKFNNIKINGEHGIFIYGNENKNIKNVSFDNIDVELKRKTNYDLNLYDLRPTYKNKLFKDDLVYVYMANAKNIEIGKIDFHSKGEISSFIKNSVIKKNID